MKTKELNLRKGEKPNFRPDFGPNLAPKMFFS